MSVSSYLLHPFEAFKTRVLKSMSGRDLLLEAAKRGEVVDFNAWTLPSSESVRAAQILEWQNAIAVATSETEPIRNPLLQLYYRAMYDDTVTAAVETRIERVKQTKFKWVNSATGEVNEDLTNQFRKEWFENWIQYMMEKRFYGFSVVEVSKVNKDGTIAEVKLIPRKHVLQDKGIVVKREYEREGKAYRNPPESFYIFEVGETRELGLLVKVIPLVIIKSMITSGWGRYAEVFGVPLRWVKTESTSKTRLDQLFKMLVNMGQDPVAVLQGDEELNVMDNKLGAEGYKNFDVFWQRADSAILRVLLGNDSTVSNKDATGTYGGIKAMVELQEYRHCSDKTFVQNLVNKFIDKWQMFGYNVSGMQFEWDELEELDQDELITACEKLSGNFELDIEYLQKRGLPIVKQINTQSPPAGPKNPLGK